VLGSRSRWSLKLAAAAATFRSRGAKTPKVDSFIAMEHITERERWERNWGGEVYNFLQNTGVKTPYWRLMFFLQEHQPSQPNCSGRRDGNLPRTNFSCMMLHGQVAGTPKKKLL
jgi:hypothetical protein